MKFHPGLQDITSRCERDSSAHPILYHNVSACRADMENFKTDTQRESVANFPAQGPSGRMSALGSTSGSPSIGRRPDVRSTQRPL